MYNMLDISECFGKFKTRQPSLHLSPPVKVQNATSMKTEP